MTLFAFDLSSIRPWSWLRELVLFCHPEKQFKILQVDYWWFILVLCANILVPYKLRPGNILPYLWFWDRTSVQPWTLGRFPFVSGCFCLITVACFAATWPIGKRFFETLWKTYFCFRFYACFLTGITRLWHHKCDWMKWNKIDEKMEILFSWGVWLIPTKFIHSHHCAF